MAESGRAFQMVPTRLGGIVPPVLIAITLAFVYVIGVLPSLGQALVETHAHRQTQTAYTALLYAEHGIDLLRPAVPVLGPPGYLPQEFPIFQAAGALLIDAGLPADMAMRVTGLLMFLLCAAFVFVFARRVLGGPASIAALAAFLFNPLAWTYGRASLIEYLASASSIAFLYFAIRWLDERQPAHIAWAFLAGGLSVLVKITTGAFYLLPVLLWRDRRGVIGFRHLSVWVLVVGSLVIGIAWSGYAQTVREETPASVFLSMQNQLAWFFGSITSRIDPVAWRVPLVALIALSGFGFLVWGPLAVFQTRTNGQRPFLLALLALVVVMPLLLFNLYAVHDYYWIAVAPLAALAVGLGVNWIRERWRTRIARRLAVGLCTAWIATAVGMWASWSIIYGTPGEQAKVMQIASFVARHSEPSDWVVLRGWGWNSTFLYYARRQGIAVPEPNVTDSGVVGGQDLSGLDMNKILSDPVFGPDIHCDRDAVCRVDELP